MLMPGSKRSALALAFWLTFFLASTRADEGRPTALRFAATVTHEIGAGRSSSGRLMVVLGRPDGGEPRLLFGQTGMNSAPVLARDVAELTPGAEAVLDDRSI